MQRKREFTKTEDTCWQRTEEGGDQQWEEPWDGWEGVKVWADLDEPAGRGPVGVRGKIRSGAEAASPEATSRDALAPRGWQTTPTCSKNKIHWVPSVWEMERGARGKKVFEKENSYLTTLFKAPGLMLIALPLTPYLKCLHSNKRNFKEHTNNYGTRWSWKFLCKNHHVREFPSIEIRLSS